MIRFTVPFAMNTLLLRSIQLVSRLFVDGPGSRGEEPGAKALDEDGVGEQDGQAVVPVEQAHVGAVGAAIVRQAGKNRVE